MSIEELKYWFTELMTNPEHGWTYSKAALARAVGIDAGSATSTIKGKASGRNWIYPGEQIRYSRHLAKVLSGEIVCKKIGPYYQAVLAEHPQPLRGMTRMRYNLRAGCLQWTAPVLTRSPALPSFKQLIARG